MPAHFLLRHWQKELQVFHENFLKIQKQSDKDSIHDLRVAVKKLRAYFQLYILIIHPDHEENGLKETEKLFSALGKQRNVEVCLDLLHEGKWKLTHGLEKHLGFLLKETSERSHSALKKFNTDELKAATILVEKSFAQDETQDDEIKDLFKSYLHDIKNDLDDLVNCYHLVRKKLKEIFYWSKILPADFYFKDSEIEKIDEALDQLGSAQDQDVLRNFTRQYRKTVLFKGNAEFEKMKEIESGAKEKKQELLEKAKKKIYEFTS